MKRPIESVWDYPRPPRVEPVPELVQVLVAGTEIARTRRAWRVLETSHPPNYYLPFPDVLSGALRPSIGGGSFCEWKGTARYWDVVPGGKHGERRAWDYPDPDPDFAALRGHVALYAGGPCECFVGGEGVQPQPGGFYGGWITSWVRGPFKGGPGTAGW